MQIVFKGNELNGSLIYRYEIDIWKFPFYKPCVDPLFVVLDKYKTEIKIFCYKTFPYVYAWIY